MPANQLLQSLVSVVVGAVLGFSGSFFIFHETQKDLEVMEIRRQKVDCLANLSGLRFVIGEEHQQLDEYRSRLMFEMNRIPMLWSDDPSVLKDMRDFYADRTNDRLIKLIRGMGKTTKVSLENLSDADIRDIFLVALSSR